MSIIALTPIAKSTKAFGFNNPIFLRKYIVGNTDNVAKPIAIDAFMTNNNGTSTTKPKI